MPETDRAPLSPETRVAAGALALVSLQEVHELALFCFDSRGLGRVTLGAGSAVLLTLTFGVLIGLCFRNRLAWWLGVLVIGGTGVVFMKVSWPLLPAVLPGQERESFRRVAAAGDDYVWLMPALSRFEAVWLIAKIALLLTVPVTLLLGKLRERLRLHSPIR